MPHPIPRPALWLGLAGLLPFLWGAASAKNEALLAIGEMIAGPRLTGVPLILGYGVIILAFMSGVLWGFAARAAPQHWKGYALSVLPALWALFTVAGGGALLWLGLGFAGLLALDAMFWRQGLAPPWWMRLRVLLTTVVLACIAAAFFAT